MLSFPLFLLGSPPVQGSSVTYTESRSESATSGWTIVVFGTGMGADRTLTLKSSGAFTARDGACKRIFLPAKLAVSRIGVFKRGKMLHEGTRTELVEASGTASPELLSGGDPPEFDDEREPVRYQLARDTSGDHAVYELSSEVADTFDLQLGVEAFKSKITFDTSVNGRKEASLKFDLPSGVDYCFRYLKRPSGMLCIAPALQGPPATQRLALRASAARERLLACPGARASVDARAPRGPSRSDRLPERVQVVLHPGAGKERACGCFSPGVEIACVGRRETEVGRRDVVRWDADRARRHDLLHLFSVPRFGRGGEHRLQQRYFPQRPRNLPVRESFFDACSWMEAEPEGGSFELWGWMVQIGKLCGEQPAVDDVVRLACVVQRDGCEQEPEALRRPVPRRQSGRCPCRTAYPARPRSRAGRLAGSPSGRS